MAISPRKSDAYAKTGDLQPAIWENILETVYYGDLETKRDRIGGTIRISETIRIGETKRDGPCRRGDRRQQAPAVPRGQGVVGNNEDR